jgi:hypothetical protein
VLNRYYDKLTQAFGSHDDFVNQNEPRGDYFVRTWKVRWNTSRGRFTLQKIEGPTFGGGWGLIESSLIIE